MIISCPNCATRFVIEDSAIPADGRKVRCIRCEHVWHQTPTAETNPEPAGQPERLIIDDTIEQPANPSSGPMLDQPTAQSGGSRWWIWLVALVIAVGAAGAYLAIFMPEEFERLKSSVIGSVQEEARPQTEPRAPQESVAEAEFEADTPIADPVISDNEVFLDDAGMDFDTGPAEPSIPASQPSGADLN